MTWLLDTLVWTGALIALVLVLRRPVARHFGPRTAYALWILPLLRLILPPLVLPAPAVEAIPAAPVAAGGGQVEVSIEYVAAAPADPSPVASAIDWLAYAETALIALWAAGAVVYVVLRLVAYARLRDELLADARSVGEAGRIRLLETPGTRSPLAFGVLDKVVALPPGFMAQEDRTARDLALEHELAHHRAHDLAANFAALPLFALHWFNPLSWLGWHAMRRDQEAACDARVIAGRDRGERARYAELIAGAAAAPRAALAAPMACPVLGDKSIIQRLRNLTMTDVSERRRRVGGLLVGLGALALPLTASITYAQGSEPEPPAPPPPLAAVEAPAAPIAPDAPDAPPAPPAPVVHVERIVLDGKPGENGERHVMIVRKDDGKPGEHVVHERRIIMKDKDGKLLGPDSPEFEAHMKKLEERLGKLDEMHPVMKFDEKEISRIREHATLAARDGMRVAMLAPRVEMNCDGPDELSETKSDDGRRVIRICRTKMMGGALVGLRSARAAIAGNTDMSADTRKDVLEKLDGEIARLEAKND
ncbi:M56 family metallopeptidase [Tsuneonella sp. HG094]